MRPILNERRTVGGTVEGFDEYAVRWADHHYLCPECGCFGPMGEVCTIETADDGAEGDLYWCDDCSKRLLREEAAAEAAGLMATA
jgi:predicted SprT family Zn-dependent metalloprotease